MAKRIISVPTVTCTAFGDAGALTDTLYPFNLNGASTTQRSLISEVYLGGLASASAPMIMAVSRAHVLGVTVGSTTTFDVPTDPATAALAAPVTSGNAWTTKPQGSATGHLLFPNFNAFGGLVRWVAYPGEELIFYGTAADVGGMVVFAYTGSTASTAVGGHMVYETL